jgi:hypothetical protein
MIDRLKALPDDTVGRSPVLSVFYRYMFHGLRRFVVAATPGFKP